MDIGIAVVLAYNISQFLDIAFEAAQSDNRLEKRIQQLENQSKKLQLPTMHGSNLLSQEETIFLQLESDCQRVRGALVRRSEGGDLNQHLPTQGKSEEKTCSHVDNLRVMINSMRKNMNTTLALLLWTAVRQELCELGAKNSRLEANRTEELRILIINVDECFNKIKSGVVDDNEKSAIWSQVQAAVRETKDYNVEQFILNTLHFWTMDRRKESLPKEQESTFEWIFSESESSDSLLPTVNFNSWLRNEEPLFWISGKPGSGKSTLMRYIADNVKTMEGLNHWTGEDSLITASFYFWSSAKDPLQKSDTGLLRSILFQVLRRCPGLIKHAFPEEWQERRTQNVSPRIVRPDLTISELLVAYERITKLLSTTKTKFCFFIDGLDEFDGEPCDIIRLIESLSKSNNLKTCISSRQWKEFEDIFGGINPWRLYVHDLTQSDMRIYINDLLLKEPSFRKIKALSTAKDVNGLVDRIIKNSEGVFLWVFLVVRSLLDGLKGTDNISTLRHKLATIPNDLEQYFDKMIKGIDASIQHLTAQIFEVTLHAAEKLPLMCYWFMENDIMNGVGQKSWTNDSAPQLLQETAERLNVYSLGLLKASSIRPDQSSITNMEDYQWLFGFRVDFLHRTVGDYLRTADMRSLLKKWTSDTFDADRAISKACLATIAITPFTTAMFTEASRALSILHILMSHAKYLTLDIQVTILDKCIATLRAHNRNIRELSMLILGPGNYWSYESSFDFAMLFYCVSYGLGDYVGLQLDKRKLQFPEPLSGLLSGCVSWDSRVRLGRFRLDFDTVDMLLGKGLDPNIIWGDRGFSFWQSLLTTTYSNQLKGLVTQIEIDAIKSAVQHGADMKATVEIFSGRKLGDTKSIDVLEKILPREQFAALRVTHVK